MLKIDFLVFYYMETVGVKWPGLKDKNSKLSDTLLATLLTYVKKDKYSKPPVRKIGFTLFSLNQGASIF